MRALWTNNENTILYITYSGTDRHLIAQTLNTLIEGFVRRNIDLKKKNIREVVQILTEQLKQAKETPIQEIMLTVKDKNESAIHIYEK